MNLNVRCVTNGWACYTDGSNDLSIDSQIGTATPQAPTSVSS